MLYKRLLGYNLYNYGVCIGCKWFWMGVVVGCHERWVLQMAARSHHPRTVDDLLRRTGKTYFWRFQILWIAARLDGI